jgi:predicted PurR-regulated permease PerM
MENIIKPQRLFFLVLFTALFILVARIFAPFLSILMWAALFYLMISPAYNKVLKWTGRIKLKSPFWKDASRNLWAAVFAFLSLLIVAVPLTFLVIELSRQAIELLNAVSLFIERNPQFTDFEQLEEWLNSLSIPYIDVSSFDIRGTVLGFLDTIKGQFFTVVTTFAGGISSFIIGYLFMMFSLFFFLSEGHLLLNIFVRAIPIDHSYSHQFINRFKEAGMGILVGFFLTAIIQGAIAFIIFSLFKVEAALAWGALVSVTSFIPMFGAATVWIPLSIMQATQVGIGTGILFALMCGIFISTSDNFIRPFLLGGRVNMHPLLIFFSILGGIQFFGINGLVLGPLVLTLFFTSIDIFLKDNPDY